MATIVANNFPAMESGAAISGKNLVLYMNYGSSATYASPSWSLIGGITSNNFSVSLNIDTKQTKSTGYWATAAATSKEAEVSCDGVVIAGDTATEALEAFCKDDDITKAKNAIDFLLVDLKQNTARRFWAIPSSFEVSADAEGVCEFSMSATVAGGYSVVNVTVSDGTPTISA